MPLSSPAPREAIHQREIVLRGFQRADGQFDIEATLGDTKAYAFDLAERGELLPGERIHGMAMRLIVDGDFLITGVEVAMDDTPYTVCPGVMPNFDRLVGLRIGKGFLKGVSERVGGTEGCVHLRELLAQMATVAFQTIGPLRARREGRDNSAMLINTCHAFAADGALVRRRWPELAKG